MTDTAEWTILTYIAAHNDLDAYGRRSYQQILDVGSTAQVKLAALFDGTQCAERVIAAQPGSPAAPELLTDFDSGDPNALLDLIRWAFEQCHAKHYGLVLWSHGTGWKPSAIDLISQEVKPEEPILRRERSGWINGPGRLSFFRTTLKTILGQPTRDERAICFDDGSGHSLDTVELERVAEATAHLVGQPLDLFGMDACLMGSLEVAYQIRKDASFVVASEELVPGNSWPYDAIFGALRANPDMGARDLSALIVKDYLDYYTQDPPALNAGDVTKIAIDVSHVDEIREAAGALAQALMIGIEQAKDVLWQAQFDCMQTETRGRKRDPSKFSTHLWDLGTLSARIASATSDPNVKSTADGVLAALKGAAVIAEGHEGAWFDGLGGLSIYLVPPGKQRISPYYDGVALANDAHWLDMLKAYHAAVKG